MKPYANKTPYKKIALTLSLCALIIWAILGTGASLAWFNDTSPEISNIFHIADFDLTVSFLDSKGEWTDIDGRTDVFDKNAKYEPGYVQVVYLKIDNKGDRAFDFHTAVTASDATTATNVFGQEFWLHEHLKFGITTADSLDKVKKMVSTRDKAKALATMNLQNYSTDVASLEPNKTVYMALIVRMPEEVSNEANYRGEDIPKVNLGIIAKAEQQK